MIDKNGRADSMISASLAFAIGWTGVEVHRRMVSVAWLEWRRGETSVMLSREFDYRDHAVIWPIAERYNAFPTQLERGPWFVAEGDENQDSAAKAVAIHIIKRFAR